MNYSGDHRVRGRWKIWAATVLLPVGVSFTAAAAETHSIWWALAGDVCLLFVPALTADYIIDQIKRRAGHG
jgi:hypothetical protein